MIRRLNRLISILLLVFLLCSCATGPKENPKPTVYAFNSVKSDLFPFYAIGEDNNLWRIENTGAYSVGYRASYSSGGREQSFVKYLKNEDILVFATDIYAKSGVNYCSIGVQQGREPAEIIATEVKLDTLRVQNDGNLLFIDSQDTLFFRRDGIILRIEGNVAESELVGEDTFLFRLKSGTDIEGEILYPIYFSNADYRNHLMDALDIVAADSENSKAYIIKNKRNIQKRTTSVEVADCFIYADGEVLFDIPSVVLSQFKENKHMFLLSCDEEKPSLRYKLYRVDGSSPVLKAENVLAGKYISLSKDVYAYETEEKGGVKINITDTRDGISAYSLTCSLDNLYACNQYTYVFLDGELLLLENDGIGALIDDGIESIRFLEDGLICFKEKTPPYSVSVCVGISMQNKAKSVINSNVVFEDNILYYYTGGSNDLEMTDSLGKTTAFISNVDTQIGFICDKGTVAMAKNDDKTMFIVGRFGVCDTQLKIKQFIREVL